MDLTEIRTHRTGASYIVPVFQIFDGRGLLIESEEIIDFVKGSKDDPSIFRQKGYTTETLLAVCRQYLLDVNQGPLEDEDTKHALTMIQGALEALKRRADKRKAAGVQQTYKPIPNGGNEEDPSRVEITGGENPGGSSVSGDIEHSDKDGE